MYIWYAHILACTRQSANQLGKENLPLKHLPNRSGQQAGMEAVKRIPWSIGNQQPMKEQLNKHQWTSISIIKLLQDSFSDKIRSPASTTFSILFSFQVAMWPDSQLNDSTRSTSLVVKVARIRLTNCDPPLQNLLYKIDTKWYKDPRLWPRGGVAPLRK